LFPNNISHLKKLGHLADMAGSRSGAGKVRGNMETSCGRQQGGVFLLVLPGSKPFLSKTMKIPEVDNGSMYRWLMAE